MNLGKCDDVWVWKTKIFGLSEFSLNEPLTLFSKFLYILVCCFAGPLKICRSAWVLSCYVPMLKGSNLHNAVNISNLQISDHVVNKEIWFYMIVIL